jgi:hypothetical protein
MSKKNKQKNKNQQNESTEPQARDYGANGDEDYVLVLKPNGETKAFYPMNMVGQEPPPPIDARFVALAHVLQDQESFEFVVERFKKANGIKEEPTSKEP